MFKIQARAAAALVLALSGASQAAGLADGTFAQASSLPGGYGFVNYGGGPSTIGAWSVIGTVDLIKNYWTGPNGSYSVDMNGIAAGSITQTFDLAPGQYQLSFYIAGNPDGGPASKSVNVSVGNQSDVAYSFVSAGQPHNAMGWTLETLNFYSAGSTTLTFESTTFGANGSDVPYGAAIGDVEVAAIPEPASIGLLLAGIGMLSVMSSRRRPR